MLTALTINNVVLIEKLEIDFRNGLCALTGETGAGKSILLDSLGLALGARSESSLVRKGAERAGVTAVFDIPPSHAAHKVLVDADMESDPGAELILRRSVGADGRSKAYINDQPVSAGLLRQVGDCLVEIHGQFDTHGLLNPGTHRALLDDYAKIDGSLQNAFEGWKDKETALNRLQEEAEKSRTEESYLRESLEDLDSLDPQPGEEEILAQRRESLMHREQVMEALNNAYHALSGENDPVRAAWGALDRVADKIPGGGEGVIGALDRASSEIQEALSEIQSLSADLNDGEHNLETIDERLHALRTQARKHECEVDALAEKREELAAKLNLIEHADEALTQAVKDLEKAREQYVAQAKEVSAQRRKAAEKLDGLVAGELPPLKLEKARFVTQIEELPESEWGAHGCDSVRFLVSTNPGREPGPLNKIASGGEMARFMLALKVVMAETGSAGTLIFDEVDTGIGGAVADAVGERLARLASTHQIMVVTHAPQVAARAGHHYIVQKSGGEDIRTNIIHLDAGAERREEIARMLAGATITEEARAAADKLLEGRAA